MGRTLCPVIIGRERELGALEAALGHLALGRGTCLVVSGEAGIGKSRLTRELTNRAAVPVAFGRAVPSGAGEPYRPLTEALLHLVRGRDVPADFGAGTWARALAPVLPTVPWTAAPAGDGLSAPVRGEAVLQLLRRVAPGGAVMVLEDLHWADPDTVALVEYMADHVAGEALILAVTSRDEPAGPFAAAARRLWGRPGVVHLPLGRLTPAQTAAMVARCLDEPGPDRRHLARVQESAEGVPLLVEELLASPGLPQSIGDTVVGRLAEMTPVERQVLEAAAVLGRQFDWELLPAATGLSGETVAAALGSGVDRQLLSVEGPAFRFRHALTRDAVMASMLPPHRRRVAGAALDAIDAAHTELPVPLYDTAADLAVQAGRPDRAGVLLYATGCRALQLGAIDTAVQTLARAVELAQGDPARAEAELALVKALALAGRVDEAASIGQGLIHRSGETGESAGQRLEAHLLLAQAAVSAARWPMAGRHLEAASNLSGAGSGPQDGSDVRLALISSEVDLAAGRMEEARQGAEQALALATEGGGEDSSELRCHAFEILGRSCRLHDLARARAFFERGLAEADAAGLAHRRLRALHEVGTIDMFHHLGVDRLLDARALAEQAGAVTTTASLDLQLAACFTARWELDRSDEHARSAVEWAERFRLEVIRAKATVSTCANASMRADAEATEEYGRRARAITPDDEWLRGFCVLSRGMARLVAGHIDEAVEPIGAGATAMSRVPHSEPATARTMWPLLLACKGDHRAPAAIEQARRLGVAVFSLNRGIVDYAEAIVAGRAGDRGRAERIAAEADPLFANSGAWLDLVRLLAAEPAMRDGWGEPVGWVAGAAGVFDRLGLAGLAALAVSLASSASANPWAASGVTDREAQVLRLVSQGRANKEIATELGLSVRTVEKHVESLLRKTGARSRTELAVGVNAT